LVASTVIGIDDAAWRRNQRYGTIIFDLERRKTLAVLPTGGRRRPRNGLPRSHKSPSAPATAAAVRRARILKCSSNDAAAINPEVRSAPTTLLAISTARRPVLAPSRPGAFILSGRYPRLQTPRRLGLVFLARREWGTGEGTGSGCLDWQVQIRRSQRESKRFPRFREQGGFDFR
jgi:hypothetical protein